MIWQILLRNGVDEFMAIMEQSSEWKAESGEKNSGQKPKKLRLTLKYELEIAQFSEAIRRGTGRWQRDCFLKIMGNVLIS